jgi:hypothetical protein
VEFQFVTLTVNPADVATGVLNVGVIVPPPVPVTELSVLPLNDDLTVSVEDCPGVKPVTVIG